jgi:PAS domain S-box-containing protein
MVTSNHRPSVSPGRLFVSLGSSSLRTRAGWVASGYALFATMWIYFSDHLLALLVPEPDLRLSWSVFKGVGFVAVTTLLLWLFMRKAFGAIEAGYELYKSKAEQLHESEEQLEAMLRTAMDAIVVVNGAGRVELFNAAAERMFGCSGDFALTRPLADFLAGGSDGMGEGKQVLRGRRINGGEFPLEASISPLGTGARPVRILILNDISERRAHEAEIERLKRLHAARSHINQAIVWTPTRNELFRKVCRALVEQGGFRMAWISWHDPVLGQLVPVAECGDENGYLGSITVYADDRPEGRGPTDQAFRGGRPYICNDLIADPISLPWRDEILRRGFRASAAFPVRERDKVVGVLSVYADEPGCFQDKEIGLLAEAATDLSFAIGNLARERERWQAEQSARTERVFSDTMIESLPGILYFYDTDGHFLRWNRNFESVSGYSGEEIARMHPLDFFAGDEKRAVEERIGEAFTKGESSVEASFIAKDGRATPYFFTGRRVDFEGRVCLVGVGIDLSEQHEAEAALREAQERFEVVVEHMREGLIIATPGPGILHWNPASLRLLGFKDVDEGRRRQGEFGKIFELSTLEGIAIPSDQWPLARLRRGEPFVDLEVRVRRRDTDWQRVLSYSGTIVRYAGDKALAFMTVSDITQRKGAEQLLRNARDVLEAEVGDRTAELQAALVRAEAADRIKSAFLATMSHELRTPLNSIIGFTGIILQGLAGPLNAEQAKQLGMVRGSARHLLDLINDVLDISKIEAGQLEVRCEPFELPELIERVVATVRPQAEKKGLTLTVHVPPELGRMVSDRRRLMQILLNVVNNAIKFTDQGGVTLTAALVASKEPKAGAQVAVRFSVVDTGIGIKPEDLATLFQPFRQLETGLARHHEGTGLGLAICRRLASLLEGEITARSEWGKGSEFAVVIPLHPSPSP